MDSKVLLKVFENYPIDNIIMINEDKICTFIISNMSNNISIERWNYLENILTSLLKKEINIIPSVQAQKHLSENYLKKGVVLK